jgi:hypothetical protein
MAPGVLPLPQRRLTARFADNACLSVRAFAATAGEKVYESLQVWAQDTGAVVEEDKVVTIDKSHS